MVSEYCQQYSESSYLNRQSHLRQCVTTAQSQLKGVKVNNWANMLEERDSNGKHEENNGNYVTTMSHRVNDGLDFLDRGQVPNQEASIFIYIILLSLTDLNFSPMKASVPQWRL